MLYAPWALPRRVAFAKAKWLWMAILVLISRDAHQNGLEAKPTLRGKPKASATGVCFLGYFFCTSKRSNSLSESEIKLSKPGSNSVNSTRYMHCHAVTENRSLRFQYFHHPWRLHGNEKIDTVRTWSSERHCIQNDYWSSTNCTINRFLCGAPQQAGWFTVFLFWLWKFFSDLTEWAWTIYYFLQTPQTFY